MVFRQIESYFLIIPLTHLVFTIMHVQQNTARNPGLRKTILSPRAAFLKGRAHISYSVLT